MTTTEPLTDAEVEDVRRPHRPMTYSKGTKREHQRCYMCDEQWPCPVERLAATIDALRKGK